VLVGIVWTPLTGLGLPHYALFQHSDLEVDEQSERKPTCAHVGHQLRFVNAKDLRHHLQLDGQAILYQQINAIAAIQTHAFVG